MKKVLSVLFASFLSIFIMFGCTDASTLQPSEPVEPVIFDSEDDNQPIKPLVGALNSKCEKFSESEDTASKIPFLS